MSEKSRSPNLSNDRLRLYEDAKAAYEGYIGRFANRDLSIADLSPEEHEDARRDATLAHAERQFLKARQLSADEDALADVATATIQLGYLYIIFARWDWAEREFLSALEVFSNLPMVPVQIGSRSACHYYLGVIFKLRGDKEAAIRELRRTKLLDTQHLDFAGLKMTERLLTELGVTDDEGDTASLPLAERLTEWRPSTEPEPPPDTGPTVDPRASEGRYPHRREVLRLLSCEDSSADFMNECLLGLGNEFGRPIAIHRAATKSTNPSHREFPELELGQHLCAVIAVADRRSLQDAKFVAVLSSFVERLGNDRSFRFILYLSDLGLDDLRKLAETSSTIDSLLQFVQIEEQASMEDLRKRLIAFVKNVDLQEAKLDFEDANRFYVLAFGALWIPITALLLGATVYMLIGHLQSHDPLWESAVVDALLGYTAVLLQAPIAYFVFRGIRATYLTQRNQSFMHFFMRGFAAIFVMNWLEHAMGSHHLSSWLIFGTILGLVVDCGRRAAIRARRQRLSIEAREKQARNPHWRPEHDYSTASQPCLSCPYMPQGQKLARIFISYSRGSEGASRFATNLYTQLLRNGTKPFLDRHSIPLGSNWREELRRNIGLCDVFVAILDQHAVSRSWVAAEILTAIDSNSKSGTPEVLLLVDPAVDFNGPGVLDPISYYVNKYSWSYWGGEPKVVPLNSQSSATVAWSLGRPRFSPESVVRGPSVIPFVAFMFVAGFFSILGMLTGSVALILGLLQTQTQFPYMATVVGYGAAPALFLAFAYWLGANARMSLELMAQRRGVLSPPSIAETGHLLSLSLFWNLVPVELHIWAPLLAVVGFMLQTCVYNGSETEGLWIR